MARYILFLLVFAASALYQAREVGGETTANKELITPNLNGPATPANTIFRLENEAMEQWRQGNPLRWVEISTDDVIYVDPTLATPVIGTKAYREYLTPLLGKVRYDASEFVNPRVALVGDLAVLTYNYHSLRRDVDGKMKRTSFGTPPKSIPSAPAPGRSSTRTGPISGTANPPRSMCRFRSRSRQPSFPPTPTKSWPWRKQP